MTDPERVEDAEFLRTWADGLDEQMGYECVNAARMRRIADTLMQPEGEPVGEMTSMGWAWRSGYYNAPVGAKLYLVPPNLEVGGGIEPWMVEYIQKPWTEFEVPEALYREFASLPASIRPTIKEFLDAKVAAALQQILDAGEVDQ